MNAKRYGAVVDQQDWFSAHPMEIREKVIVSAI